MANSIAPWTEVPYGQLVPLRRFGELIDEARTLLVEARQLMELPPAGGDRGSSPSDDAILVLYERLRVQLSRVDVAAVSDLMVRIGRNIDDLGQVEKELDRIRKLRSALDKL